MLGETILRRFELATTRRVERARAIFEFRGFWKGPPPWRHWTSGRPSWGSLCKLCLESMMAAETTANQKVVSRGHRKKGRSCALSGVAATFEFTHRLVDVSGTRNTRIFALPRKCYPENCINMFLAYALHLWVINLMVIFSFWLFHNLNKLEQLSILD